MAGRISELILRQGKIDAQRHMDRGASRAGTISALAGFVPGLQQRRAAEAEGREAAFTRGLQRDNVRSQIASRDSETARADADAMRGDEARQLAAKTDRVSAWLSDVASNSDLELQRAAYRSGRSQLVSEGVLTPQDAPEMFPGMSWVKTRFTLLLPAQERFKAMFPEAPKPNLHNVSPGQSVLDANAPGAGPVFEAPKAEPSQQPPSVGSFEDFVTQKHGPRPTPDQIAGARKDYNQADDRGADPILQQIRAMTLANLQKNQGSMTPAQFSMATRLADDYTQQSKDYLIRVQANDSIKTAAANPSAAGDLALIFSYMRMLDPGSTVREGEFANAQNSAGVPDQIRNLYNRAASGERLNPNQRADFVAQAGAQFSQAQQRQRGLIQVYTQRAQRSNLNPADVVIDFDTVFAGNGQPAPHGGALPNPDAGGVVTVQTPAGPMVFPNQQAADAFKRRAGIP